MKKSFLSILCFMLVNCVFAQVTDTTIIKTTKVTKTIITTTITTEEEDSENSVKRDRQNIIKTNFTSLFAKTIHLNYERTLSKKITAQIGVFYTFYNGNSSNGFVGVETLTTEFSGFGITPEIRLYPQGKALNSFFVAFSPRYQNFNFTVSRGAYDNNGNATDAKANWSAFNIAALVGKQWLFKEVFSLELYGGPAFVGGVLDITKGTRQAFTLLGTGINSGITLRFGLTAGLAF